MCLHVFEIYRITSDFFYIFNFSLQGIDGGSSGPRSGGGQHFEQGDDDDLYS